MKEHTSCHSGTVDENEFLKGIFLPTSLFPNFTGNAETQVTFLDV